jgi:uncharacterized membrane protein
MSGRHERPGGVARAVTRFARTVHVAFDVGIVLKGINGVLEIAGGVLLLALSSDQVYRLAGALTLHELTEDPHDILATHIMDAARHLTRSGRLFGAAWLLIHGIVKVGLVAALLRRRHWAYPVAIAVFLLFLVYQLYRYAETLSVPLLVLVVLDVFVVIVTSLEYRRLVASGDFA